MTRIIFKSLICIIVCGFCTQTSSGAEPDSLTLESKHRANKAALYSAILPGAGQAYNKKYWKIPVLYAGIGTLVYFIRENDREYEKFKTAFLYRNDSDPETIDNFPNLTNDDLRVRKDYYRRNRDLSYILTGVVYTLNIIDAYVDAQLRDFDVSENLSLRSRPFFYPAQNGNLAAGINLTFTLK